MWNVEREGSPLISKFTAVNIAYAVNAETPRRPSCVCVGPSRGAAGFGAQDPPQLPPHPAVTLPEPQSQGRWGRTAGLSGCFSCRETKRRNREATGASLHRQSTSGRMNSPFFLPPYSAHISIITCILQGARGGGKLRPSAHGCQRQRHILAGDLALPSGPLPTSVSGYCSAPLGLSLQMKILLTPAGRLGDGGRLPRGWSWTITSETCVTQTDLWQVILLLSHVTTFHQRGPGKGHDDEAHPPVSLGARTLQSHWGRAGASSLARDELGM
ncbi:uncharacterized protein LOC125093508 isoform X2 [Lutra lutra]|uniref:uncharacterized protein LOC125093508 isoform X2 n=1 Tax=Lutra lutra TaxID=9657 RepID=UPI001FD05D6D|nr:uncharacterized protein LOC125093508 isoform X2 [Lutra lutra]